jgi:hypothetical protein
MKMFESELKNNLNGLCQYLFGAREVLQSAVGNYRHNPAQKHLTRPDVIHGSRPG